MKGSFDYEEEMEQIRKEKPTLKRLFDSGYELNGMFVGYIVMRKKNRRILYNKIKDEIVTDEKYIGNKFNKDI